MQLSTLVRGFSALPLMKVVMLGWWFMEDLAAVTQRAGYSLLYSIPHSESGSNPG
jgi:hypothetical protein